MPYNKRSTRAERMQRGTADRNKARHRRYDARDAVEVNQGFTLRRLERCRERLDINEGVLLSFEYRPGCVGYTVVQIIGYDERTAIYTGSLDWTAPQIGLDVGDEVKFAQEHILDVLPHSVPGVEGYRPPEDDDDGGEHDATPKRTNGAAQ